MTHSGTSLLMLMTSLLVTSRSVSGHGRLIEPPSRSSMWRAHFDTPHNYDDNALNCGGLNTQWYVNQGKCGVCGDPWNKPTPRDNEAGGRYGKGVITRTYTPGQTVGVGVEITANHKGWFEFRLCPHNDPTTPITQQCLDNNLLSLADGSGTRYDLGGRRGRVDVKVKLPQGLTCTQCVLQWKWHAGNNAGSIQEEFYGCSDIAIGASAATLPPVIVTTAPPTVRPTPPPTGPPTAPPTALHTAPPTAPHTALPTAAATGVPTSGGQAGSGVCRGIKTWQGVPELDRYCSEQCPLGNCPAMYCACSASPTGQPTTYLPPMITTPGLVTAAPPLTTSASCYAIGLWQGMALIDQWCRENCAQGVCPATSCRCDGQTSTQVMSTARPTAQLTPRSSGTVPPVPPHTGQPLSGPCYGINVWQGVPELDQYCTEQCPLGNCPANFCACTGGVPHTPTSSTVTHTVPHHAQPTTAPTPHLATPSTVNLTNRCIAIGNWRGMAQRDQWCNDNCPLGLCPSQNCQCGLPTTIAPLTTSPAPQQCRAIGTWAGQPDLDAWCTQTCPKFGCNANYCSCGPAPTGVTITSPNPVTNSTLCYAINGWAGNPQLDQYCLDQCRAGLCPPQYCACRPAAQATPQSATPPPSLPPTAPPLTPTAAAQNPCRAINTWQGVAELDRWCRDECAGGHCPPAYCSCQP